MASKQIFMHLQHKTYILGWYIVVTSKFPPVALDLILLLTQAEIVQQNGLKLMVRITHTRFKSLFSADLVCIILI